jgi:hypothetical protein
MDLNHLQQKRGSGDSNAEQDPRKQPADVLDQFTAPL